MGFGTNQPVASPIQQPLHNHPNIAVNPDFLRRAMGWPFVPDRAIPRDSGETLGRLDMTKDVVLKMLKDSVRGLITAISPLLINGLTGASAWITVLGGILSAILGVVAGIIRGSQTNNSDWCKIANDSLYGLLIGAQSFLQTGLTPGVKLTYVLCGLGIMALGVFSNILKNDFAPQTAALKIVKDVVVSVINTAVPVLQAGLSAGTSLAVILAGFAHTAFSVAGNTVESDLFGLSKSQTTPASK
jgi:hypothetical protein